MIHERSGDIKVVSNMTGEKFQMGLDPNATAHLMSVLTDLYSNPPYAVVREYGTNARDAQIEAGIERAIEVTLPNAMAPFFTTRDYGVGLSVEDIHAIYSQYGASTKRGTNAQNGMLGLGCKAALTYTSVFTVTSVKNGTRVQVSVSRDEDGGGSMTIVDTCATDDHTGTTITVPVRREDHAQFRDEAEKFYRYWQPGTVLLDGREPSKLSEAALKVDDNLYIVSGGGNDKLVMANVPYPIDRHRLSSAGLSLPYGFSLVAFVPTGSVNFTPSREALHYTQRTLDTIKQTAQSAAPRMTAAVQRGIEQAKTAPEALAAMYEWSALIGNKGTFHWQGHQIPWHYKAPMPPQGKGSGLNGAFTDTDYPLFVTQNASYNYARGTRTDTLRSDALKDTLWVHGWPGGNFTAPQKKKLRKYVEDAGIQGVGMFVLSDKPQTAAKMWVETFPTVDWATIKAIKLPRSTRTHYGRLAGSYDAVVNGSYTPEVAADDIDTSYPVFWVEGDRYYAIQMAEAVAAFHPQHTVVRLTSTRIEKFKRNFPAAVPARVALRKAMQDALAALTPTEKIALSMQEASERERLLSFVPIIDRLDDPDLKRDVKLAQTDLTNVNKQRKVFRNALYGEAFESGLKYDDNPLRKYTLLAGRTPRTEYQDHMVLYMNAVYAALNPQTQEV